MYVILKIVLKNWTRNMVIYVIVIQSLHCSFQLKIQHKGLQLTPVNGKYQWPQSSPVMFLVCDLHC